MTHLSGVVNTYTKVVSMGVDAQSGASTLALAAPGLAAGDRVLVVQMQGASINTSNTETFGSIGDLGGAGLHAWATVAAAEGPSVRLDRALPPGFDVNAAMQVVKVPAVAEDAVVTGQIKASPWNGESGGVVALDVPGTLSLAANIDVSNSGFRGGDRSVSKVGTPKDDYVLPGPSEHAGEKGEGISRVAAETSAGRGAPANGGGGGHSHNAGGGGGGLGGAGGQGGRTWSDYLDIGGRGGRALSMAGRAFLGGGGGGGHQNDGQGGRGGSGGGLVVLRARKIEGRPLPVGKPAILANGEAGGGATNDGGGGGGAGGTILLDTGELGGALLLEARGGAGGRADGGHGPGGGGGGGEIRTTMDIVFPAGFELNVEGGAAGGEYGTTASAAGVCPEKRLSIGARSLTVFPGYEGALVVTLRNTGVVALAVTSLSVAQIPWISLPAGASLPSALGPGEEVQVVMAVAVSANATLGVVDTSIEAVGSGSTFRAPLRVEITAAPGQNLRVRVRDRQTGSLLPNAAVAIDASPGLFYTNAAGELLLGVPAGPRKLDAVAPHYLPSGTTVDCGATLTTAEITLLAGQPLITGVAVDETHNSDGSSWVYEFTVTTGIGQIHLGGVNVSTSGGGDTITVPFGPTNVVGGAGGSVTGQVIFIRPPNGDAAPPHEWPQLWLFIPGGIRVLKQFWNVVVCVYNGCLGYKLHDVIVGMNDPRPGLGVPLFPGVPNDFTWHLETIDCLKHKSASLTVRGDVPGRYRVQGQISAKLRLNEQDEQSAVNLDAAFQSEEIVVALPQFDVSFDVFPKDQDIVQGQTFEFRVHITNRSTMPMQGVEVFLDPERLVGCSPSTPNPPVLRVGTIAGSYPGAIQSRDAIFTLLSKVTGRVRDVSYTLSSTPTGTIPVLAPVLDGKPAAQPDAVKTYSGQPVEIQVLTNDTDPEGKPLRVASVTQGAGGGVGIGPNGIVYYTPSNTFVGIDTFSYTIMDAAGQTSATTVSVDVRANPITLTLGAESVQSGQSVSGSASTPPSASKAGGGARPPISLTSNHPAAQVPASIPNPGSFTVKTTPVGVTQYATITAAWGDARRSQTLKLLPAGGIEIPKDPMPEN